MSEEESPQTAADSIPTTMEVESTEVVDGYDPVLQQQEEEATEQEQTDFEAYQRQIKRQGKVIDSYEKMLEHKEISEKKSHINKLNNKVGAKIMNLHASSAGEGHDRLKLTKSFYQDIWDGIKTDILFGGDVKKQYRILELLAAQEYEVKPAREVRELLEEEFPELFT